MKAFGEYLVENHVLDRFQLFRVLQLKDRAPDARLGQCAVALGYVLLDEVEQLHARFIERDRETDLDTMPTTAFDRYPEIEIVGSTI